MNRVKLMLVGVSMFVLAACTREHRISVGQLPEQTLPLGGGARGMPAGGDPSRVAPPSQLPSQPSADAGIPGTRAGNGATTTASAGTDGSMQSFDAGHAARMGERAEGDDEEDDDGDDDDDDDAGFDDD